MPENIPAATLCCDWAVHPRLSGLGARDVLKLFDDCEIECVRTRADITSANFKSLHESASHSAFRDELSGSPAPHGVNLQLLKSDAYWRSFVRRYTAGIQGCPHHFFGTKPDSPSEPVDEG